MPPRARRRRWPAAAAASGMFSPVRTEVVRTWTPSTPSSLQQPDEVLSTRLDGALREQPVDLVEDDEHDGRVPRQLLHVLVVQQRVRVLLGVGHPDEHVAEREHALGLPRGGRSRGSRSPAGRAGPPRPSATRPARRSAHRTGPTTTCRRGTASQSRSGPAARRRSSPADTPPADAVSKWSGVGRPDLSQLLAGQRVEERGLPAARRPGQCDHGVVTREGVALAPPWR